MPTCLRAKCVVVGDSTVGKSALCQAFHSDGSHFPKNYTMTTGVELLVKHVNIPDSKDSVELYMYDSAGKEIFAEHVQNFWEQPSVVMVVYDVTSETSFSSCAKWLERVKSQKPEVQIPGSVNSLSKNRLLKKYMSKKYKTLNTCLLYFSTPKSETWHIFIFLHFHTQICQILAIYFQ